MQLPIDCPRGQVINMAKKINQTNVSVQVEIQGKVVIFSKEVDNHELEEATAALLNSVLLLESTLND